MARHGSLRTARSSRISQICRATNEPTVSSTSKKEILEAPIHIDTSFPYGTESPINTPAKLDEALARMKIAQKEFAKLTQEQVDVIFQKVAMEANMHRLDLAMYAVEDTKKGVIEDKVIKNHFASEFVYNKCAHP